MITCGQCNRTRPRFSYTTHVFYSNQGYAFIELYLFTSSSRPVILYVLVSMCFVSIFMKDNSTNVILLDTQHTEMKITVSSYKFRLSQSKEPSHFICHLVEQITPNVTENSLFSKYLVSKNLM